MKIGINILNSTGDIYLSNYPDLTIKFYEEAKILKQKKGNLKKTNTKLKLLLTYEERIKNFIVLGMIIYSDRSETQAFLVLLKITSLK